MFEVLALSALSHASRSLIKWLGFLPEILLCLASFLPLAPTISYPYGLFSSMPSKTFWACRKPASPLFKNLASPTWSSAQRINSSALLTLSFRLYIPSAFLTGKYDPVNFFTGSNYENSEDLKNRIGKNYKNLLSVCLLDDAGHWVQQEKPKEVNKFILDFLSGL